MKILVTGAAGFIGFHTAKRLLDQGFNVVGVDIVNDYYDIRVKNKRNDILLEYENYKFYKEDIGNYEAMKKIAEENEIYKIFIKAEN